MNQAKRNYLLFYFAMTVVISFAFCFIAKADGVDFGFGRRLFASLLSIPTGFIGVLLGDLIRRFAIPDMVFTTGGFFQLLKTRLFWMCGPQLIGMTIGIAVVLGQFLK